MIYIFSESNDTTTDGVIQSLINRNADYVRMDLDLNYLGIDFALNNFSDIDIRISYWECEYIINKQDSIWFRRGNINTYIILNNFKNYSISTKIFCQFMNSNLCLDNATTSYGNNHK